MSATPGSAKSWGHELRKLTAAEIDRLRQRAALTAERWPDLDWRETWCRTGKCRQEATHETYWRYTTGRAGRVSSTRRLVCDEHAAKFRTKHQLPESEGETRP